MATVFKLGAGAEKYTCPYCKTQFKEGDKAISCPACQTLHHASCWEENKGCTTFGCSEQHYETQGTNPTDVCPNCGSTLGDGQEFCPKCGTPKGGVKKNICSKCGTELQDGQEFCPKCGQKADLQIDSGVNSAISQFNASVTKTNEKKKKTPLIVGIIAGVVVLAVVLIIALGGSGGKKDFHDMYGDIAAESWCTIASDGSYMKIDTNPYNIDDYIDTTAYYKIKTINSDLGFSSALFEEMGQTRALDGRQSDSNDKYEVSWSYHPDNGLEVMYKVKSK